MAARARNDHEGVVAVGECCVCLETFPLLSLACAHAFCEGCIVQAIHTACSSATLPIPCLQCNEPMDRSLVVRLLSPSPDRLLAFERLELNLCLKRDPLVRFCISPDCPNAFVCDALQAKCPRISCPSCLADSCFLCRQSWHPHRRCRFDGSDSVKPCPGCGVTIYKGRQDGCNAMKCSLCQYGNAGSCADFCWLCLKRIDPLNGIGHFTSFRGCTMFGSRSWSTRKQLAAQLTLPFTVPMVAAGAAVAGAAFLVTAPVLTGTEEWKRGGTTTARVVRTSFAVAGSLIVVPPMVALGVVGLTLRMAFMAYVQMPLHQSKSLLRKVFRRRGGVERTSTPDSSSMLVEGGEVGRGGMVGGRAQELGTGGTGLSGVEVVGEEARGLRAEEEAGEEEEGENGVVGNGKLLGVEGVEMEGAAEARLRLAEGLLEGVSET